MKRLWSLLLALTMVAGLLPAMTFGSVAATELQEIPSTIVTGAGDDVTELLTDHDVNTYLTSRYERHYYDEPSGCTWLLQGSKLLIGGKGSVSAENGTFPWEKVAGQITEVVIFPNTVTEISAGAFAMLKNLQTVTVGEGVKTVGASAFANGSTGMSISLPSTLKTVGNGIAEGCQNLTVVLNGLTKAAFLSLAGGNNAALQEATYIENTVERLTVTPSGDGFVNADGVTELRTLLKTADGKPLQDADAYDWRILVTDGERIREGGGWFSNAHKLLDLAPAAADEAAGLYRFEICNAPGENQFIPQYESAYVITVQLFRDGVMVYSGASAVNQFQCKVWPIYSERTATPTYSGVLNYVEQDLGKPMPVAKLGVYCYDSGSRYTQWQAYGSNDNTLPLSMWTLLTEKDDTESNLNDIKTARTYELPENADGSREEYRYIRYYGSYDSSRWSIIFSEIQAYMEVVSYNAFTEVSGSIKQLGRYDVTNVLTDNNTGTSMSELHWYDSPDGYTWLLQDGKLLIGGEGSVSAVDGAFPWAKLSDVISEIVIFPNTVTGIEAGAFADLRNLQTVTVGEGVKTVGAGAFAGGSTGMRLSLPSTLKTVGNGIAEDCEDLTVVLNGLTKDAFLALAGGNNAALSAAEYIENTVERLTVTPSGNGFVNADGVTELRTLLKTADGKPLQDPDAYDWRILVTDGERIREGGTWFSNAHKLLELAPDASDEETGLYRFAICNAPGENQFIPQYDSAYVITVQLFRDGVMVYSGASAVNQFKCTEWPIYSERTATPTYSSGKNYIEEDFGKPVEIAKLRLSIDTSWNRYTQWQAYGSNDNTLPLSMWTLLTEKDDTVINSEDNKENRYFEVTPKADGSYQGYRYLRIYGSYDSQRWSLIYNELHVMVPLVTQDVTFVVNGTATVVPTGKGEIPTVETPTIPADTDGCSYSTFHVFTGWDDGQNFYPAGKDLPAVTKDVTYTAVFKEVTENWYSRGDTDLSGTVSISDVTTLLIAIAEDGRYLEKMVSAKRTTKAMLDVNRDGSISIGDVTDLLALIAESTQSGATQSSGKYTTLVLPAEMGEYLDACVRSLAAAAANHTGTALLTAAEATGSSLKANGLRLCFGITAETPESLYGDLQSGDYRICREGNNYYILATDALTLGAAAKKAEELLAAGDTALPVVYRATEKTAVTIRVGSYNIQNGGVVNHNFSVLANDILKQGLDIVGLQEVDQFTSRSGKKDSLKLLSEATGYPYYQFCKCIDLQGGEYGTAILSRYPIVSYESVLLYSPGSEQRGYGHAVINVEGVEIDFFNTHLAWPNADVRAQQFIDLSAVFRSYPKAILTGDLNEADRSRYAHLFPGCNFANGVANTYITNEEDGPIDNIISTASTITQLRTGMVGNVVHSDHYMLWADLAIAVNGGFAEESDGIRYYEGGKAVTGWQVIGDNTLYFDPQSGLMAKGKTEIGGKYYTFEPVSMQGMTLYRLSDTEEPVKELAPGKWVEWLLREDGATYRKLENGFPYLTKYTADNKNHKACALTVAMNRPTLAYVFDEAELGAALQDCTVELYYREVGSTAPYSRYETAPYRVLELGDGAGSLCLLPLDPAKTSDLRSNNGRARDYSLVFVLSQNGETLGWHSTTLTATDSYDLFLKALNK